jgi:hypothetical protein
VTAANNALALSPQQRTKARGEPTAGCSAPLYGEIQTATATPRDANGTGHPDTYGTTKPACADAAPTTASYLFEPSRGGPRREASRPPAAMLHYQQQRDEVGETNPSSVAHPLRNRRSFAIADVTPRIRLNSSF